MSLPARKRSKIPQRRGEENFIATTSLMLSKDNNGTKSGLHLVDDNAIVIDKVTCEILSRLSVRSLMRFKCVCKPWRLLVEKNPYFIDLHHTHSNTRPNFFFVIEKPLEFDLSTFGDSYRYNEACRKIFLVTTDNLSFHEGRDESVANIHNLREIDVPHCVRFFGPLNGLIGFYDVRHYFGIRLSNVCTQETTPWMKSTLLRKNEQGNEILIQTTDCQLGFDPTTKKHKVVCIRKFKYCSKYRSPPRPNVIFCDVFTVGDFKWRSIAGVPSNVIEDNIGIGCSVYVNGYIYYSTSNFMKSEGPDNDKIVVFDVGLEKFESITIPNCIIGHPRDIDNTIVNPIDLLEMDGHLAVLCRVNGYIVKLWLYDNDDDDCRRKNFGREVTIELPYIWDTDLHLTFHSVVGKDQLILKSTRFDKSGYFSYHSYNWRKKTFIQLEFSGAIPSSVLYDTYAFMWDKTYVESLLHVQ